MENINSMVVSPEGILIPPSMSPVESALVTSLTNPCRAIVPYQLGFDDSPRFPSPISSPSLPLPPVSQKSRTFQRKAPPLSKKASSLSSLTQSVSKRVTRSSSSLKSPSSPVQPSSLPKSNPIGPPRPPSKIVSKTVVQRLQKDKTSKIPISNVDTSSVQCFVDASKASVYQRWFGSRELWFKQIVILDDFSELHELLKIREWVHTVSKLSAPHPILICELYANLDRTVITEGHPGCVSAFVRGTRIPLGPPTIACILKVESVKNPTYGKQFNLDQTMMGRVLTDRDDYLWGKQEILATHVTPFYRVLHQVALYNWFPYSHLSSVTLEIGKFLYVVGTHVSIDLPTLIFERILEASETTGTRNKLPFPSLIQQVLMAAHPPLTTHDYQVPNPILSKSFLSVIHRQPSSITLSTSKISKGKSLLFKGLSDSSWEEQFGETNGEEGLVDEKIFVCDGQVQPDL
uniref:Putative plant transposon protein domain-containing protein n=1 Tax=Cannabis sativa TaxID=3483 RepID=A0A803QDV3_CANSA